MYMPRSAPASTPAAPRRLSRRGEADMVGVLASGTRLDRYEFENVLYRGGHSVVYLATDHGGDALVAVEEYWPSALAERGPGQHLIPRSAEQEAAFRRGLEAFVAESRTLQGLEHPSLLKIEHVWEANGTAYRQMPYYAGASLRELCEGMIEPPDEISLFALMDQLLGALEVLHGAGEVHGNITPDDVLLQADDTPVLLGFSSVRRAVVGDRAQALMNLVEPSFVAAEQRRRVDSVPHGAWTDLYALAAVVRYTIEVHAPGGARRGEPFAELVARIQQAFPQLRYSSRLIATIERTLSSMPQDRPQDVAAFRRLLASDPAPGLLAGLNLPPPREDDSAAPSIAAALAGVPPLQMPSASAALPPIPGLPPAVEPQAAPTFVLPDVPPPMQYGDADRARRAQAAQTTFVPSAPAPFDPVPPSFGAPGHVPQPVDAHWPGAAPAASGLHEPAWQGGAPQPAPAPVGAWPGAQEPAWAGNPQRPQEPAAAAPAGSWLGSQEPAWSGQPTSARGQDPATPWAGPRATSRQAPTWAEANDAAAAAAGPAWAGQAQAPRHEPAAPRSAAPGAARRDPEFAPPQGGEGLAPDVRAALDRALASVGHEAPRDAAMHEAAMHAYAMDDEDSPPPRRARRGGGADRVAVWPRRLMGFALGLLLIAGLAVLAWQWQQQSQSNRVLGTLSQRPAAEGPAASGAAPSAEDALARAEAALAGRPLPPLQNGSGAGVAPRTGADGSVVLPNEPRPAETRLPPPLPLEPPAAGPATAGNAGGGSNAGAPESTVAAVQAGTPPNGAGPSRATPAQRQAARPPVESKTPTRQADARSSAAAPARTQQREPAEPVDPRAACGSRTQFSLYYCMQSQCERPEFFRHPQCIRLRLTDEVG